MKINKELVIRFITATESFNVIMKDLLYASDSYQRQKIKEYLEKVLTIDASKLRDGNKIRIDFLKKEISDFLKKFVIY
tara:strand:+ start:1468 stop:1701 length:234 start_codon:yes stop_codon:yes gene_type:complete